MAVTQHCGDQRPHAPHTYYGPKPGSVGQQQEYRCPGTAAEQRAA